ncbi:MAG: hypothetical protein QOK15_985 [Nocardioidaceae bacterium]|nr:hypothetical protein [Nocardioidaceae bacterium]
MPDTPADDVVAHVAHLRTTPIKGFTMQESPSVFLAVDEGVAGDRAFFLMDERDKLLSATRTAAFLSCWARADAACEVLAIGRGAETLLEERVVAEEATRAHFFADRYATGHVVKGPWSDLLSEIAGERIRLVRATGPLGGFDVHPVSLLAGASVRALTDGNGDKPLDGREFRMTVTVEGLPAFTEDTWLGEVIRIGESVIRVTSQVRRCAAVQKDPEGAGKGRDALRRIKEVRGTVTSTLGQGLHLGVYGDVLESGHVQVGDSVLRVP